MAGLISSAEPQELFRYSKAGLLIDAETTAESLRLRLALERFEATCREGAFRVPVAALDDHMRRDAQTAAENDLWVAKVGTGFWLADRGGISGMIVDIGVDTAGLAYVGVKGLKDFLKYLKFAGFVLGGPWSSGTAYPGQVLTPNLARGPLLSLLRRLKEALPAGAYDPIKKFIKLPGTHGAWANFDDVLRHAKGTAKDAFKWGLIIESLGLLVQVYEDVQEYERGSAELKAAILVDAVAMLLKVAVAGSFAVTGSIVGAAFGTIIGLCIAGPPGAAVGAAAGAAIGKFLGGIAGHLVAEELVSKYRKPAIDWLAPILEEPGEALSTAKTRVVEGAETVMREAAEVTRSAADLAGRTAVGLSAFVQQQAQDFDRRLQSLLEPIPEFEHMASVTLSDGSTIRVDELEDKYRLGGDPVPGAVVNKQARPVQPEVTSAPDLRDPRIYDAVINQFGVENNSRYTGTKTYCNIFATDVTGAMGAEIPHWVDQKGRSVQFSGTPEPGWTEVNVEGMRRWLQGEGSQKWNLVSPEEAQQAANEGRPAVVLDPGGTHIAIVRPGELDSTKGPAIAQAGKDNLAKGYVLDGFGAVTSDYEKLEYYVAD